MGLQPISMREAYCGLLSILLILKKYLNYQSQVAPQVDSAVADGGSGP